MINRYFKVAVWCKLPLKWIKPIIDIVFSSIILRITIFQTIQALTNPLTIQIIQLTVVLLMKIKVHTAIY